MTGPLREAWDTVRGIAGAAVRRLSWRESFKIFRDSILTGLGERLVGVVVVAVAIGALVLVFALVGELDKMAGGVP